MAFDVEAARKDGISDDQILTHLANVNKFDVYSALKDGLTQEQIINHLASQGTKKPSETQIPSRTMSEPEMPVADWAKDYPNLYGALGAAYEVGSPLLEAAGLVGGGVAGTVASGGNPLATVGGAGLGYAGVKNISNRMYEGLTGQPQYANLIEAAIDTGKDVGVGAMYDMGGQLIYPVASGIMKPISYLSPVSRVKNMVNRGVPGSKKNAAIEAGEELIARQPKDIDTQILIEKELDRMGGVIERVGSKRLTEGQMGDDFQQRAFEQSRMSKNSELGSRVIARNDEAIKAAEDTVNQTITSNNITGQGLNKLQHGDTVRTKLKEAFDAAKQKVDAAYNALPSGIKVNTSPIRREVLKLMRDMSKAQERKTLKGLPNNTISALTRAVRGGKNKQMSVDSLRAWRSRLSNEAQTLAEQGNFAASRRMRQLRDALDDGLNNAAGVPQEYAQQFRDARKIASDFKQRFESGDSGTVLGYGNEFGGTRIVSEEIPSKFFGPKSLTSAKQLKATVGDETASNMYKDYAKDEISNAISEGSLLKVVKFIRDNKSIMNEYGVKSGDILDKASVKDLLLQKNTADQISLAQLTNNLKTLKKSGIFNDIYSRSEIQALDDLHSMVRAVGRNKNVSSTGNSATAEKVAGDAKKSIAGSIAQLFFLKAGAGFQFQATKNILTRLATMAGKDPQIAVTKLLEDAMFDPKLAKELMSIARKNKPMQSTGLIRKHLIETSQQSLRPEGILPPQSRSGYMSILNQSTDLPQKFTSPYAELINRQLQPQE